MHRRSHSIWNKMLTQLILNCSQHLWLQGASTAGKPLGSQRCPVVPLNTSGIGLLAFRLYTVMEDSKAGSFPTVPPVRGPIKAQRPYYKDT